MGSGAEAGSKPGTETGGAAGTTGAAAAAAASSAYIASMTPSGSRTLALNRIDVVDGIDPRDGLYYITLDDALATRVVVGSSFF